MVKITSVPSRTALAYAEYQAMIDESCREGFLSEEFGFLPAHPPVEAFPASHQLWDQAALELPELYKRTSIRKFFATMPVLPADESQLSDKYLWRAATLLGVFAHAYYWLEPIEPKELPKSILIPWQKVSERLKRDAPYLSYFDLILHNWQFLANTTSSARTLSNTKLLIETVGKKEERIFYLTQMEMAALSAPLVGAVVRAQEHVVEDNILQVKNEIFTIIEVVESIIAALRQIDPNPHSHTYANPIIWAKCVAPLAVSWRPEIKGPSGTSAPYFHLLDSFISRVEYESLYGQDQVYYRRHQDTQRVYEFLRAVEKISVRRYVEDKDEPELNGIFQRLIEVYAGKGGLLNVHRYKVYGYLSTAFKVGRKVTTGGTAATNPLITRDWQHVNMALNQARKERYDCLNNYSLTAKIKSNVDLINNSNEYIAKKIVFDVSHQGVLYRPGDHFGVLPVNNETSIAQCLRELKATGEERISLTESWREALLSRPEYKKNEKTISLYDFLKYAKIRPLDEKTAKALYALAPNDKLKYLIDNYLIDRYELWEILLILAEANYDLTRLWKTQAWEKENLAKMIMPLDFHLYSVSSVLADKKKTAAEIQLTVGELHYTNSDIFGNPTLRKGTATSYLCNLGKNKLDFRQKIPFTLESPARFVLPKDDSKPIVMIAGGTGISPFLSFMKQRKNNHAQKNWLFYSVKTMNDFLFHDELIQWCEAGYLNLYVVFSQDDITKEIISGNPYKNLHICQGDKRKIGDLMLSKNTSNLLWELLCTKEQLGQEACFYICGQSGFSKKVINVIEEIILRHAILASNLDEKQFTTQYIGQLIGENRLMYDVFTPFSPVNQSDEGSYRIINFSEIVYHNNDEKGYWMVLDDQIYDVSKFKEYHAGGDNIITAYAGMDATREYREVDHEGSPQIQALLSMYRIGGLKKYDFSNRWGIALREAKLDYWSLQELYQIWFDYLNLVVEIENTIGNETKSYQSDKKDEQISRQLESIAIMYDNFSLLASHSLFGKKLIALWHATIGVCEASEDFNYISKSLEKIAADFKVSNTNVNIVSILLLNLSDKIPNGEVKDVGTIEKIIELLEVLIKLMRGLIGDIKHEICTGIIAFETHEQMVIEKDKEKLVDMIRNILKIVISYFEELDKLYEHGQQLLQAKD